LKKEELKTALQFNKEKRKQKKNRATFIIAFLCFALLLAVVSTLILLKSVNFNLKNLIDRKQESTETPSETESSTFPVHYSGNANILFVCSDSSKELEFFGILNFDMDGKEISVYSFENTDEIIIEGKSSSFTDLFSSGGASGLKKAVETSYGIKIDRYINVTQTNLKKIFSRFGEVTVNSDEKINIKGKDYVLNLEKGEQSATAETVLSYFKYLSGSDRSAFACEVIDFYLNEGKIQADQENFDAVINLIETDISAKDFSNYKETANSFINDSLRKSSKAVSSIDEMKVNE